MRERQNQQMNDIRFLKFTEAFAYWYRRMVAGKESRSFTEFLDSCDKKTRHGLYGVKI